jgi:hypothetical protein
VRSIEEKLMVAEYRVGWNSGSTNPGVTVFHGRTTTGANEVTASQGLADRVRAFFDGIKTVIAGGVTWNFPGEVTWLNTSTGELESVQTPNAPANVVSTGAGTYSAPSGCRVEWRTGAIVSGRRLRGRTYFVPLVSNGYDTTGTIAAATITAVKAAADTYALAGPTSAVQPVIWSRTHGIAADITSSIIPDEAAVLRSRRE